MRHRQRNSRILLIIMLGLFLPSVGVADVRVIQCDLQSCLDMAIANHPILKASEAAQMAARALIQMREAAHLPNLALESGVVSLLDGLSVPQSVSAGAEGEQAHPAPGPPVDGGISVGDAGALMSPTATLLSEESSKVRQARYALAQEEWSYLVQRNKVMESVAEAYVTVLQRRETVKSYERITAFTEANYRLAQAKYTQGLIARKDLLKEDVNLEEAKETLGRSRHDLRRAKNSLLSLIGGGIQYEIEIAELSLSSPRFAPLEQLVAHAREHHPDVMVQEFKVLDSLETLGTVQSSQYPIRSLSDQHRPAGDEKGSVVNQWMAQVQRHIPLFDFGVLRKEEEAARADVAEAKHRLMDITRGVTQMIEDRFFKIQEMEDEIRLLNKRIALATEEANLARARFREGLSHESEALEAEVTLLETKLALTNALYGKELATFELKVATEGAAVAAQGAAGE